MFNGDAIGVAWSCGTGAECGAAHSHAMSDEDIGSNLESVTEAGSRRMQLLRLRPWVLTDDNGPHGRCRLGWATVHYR